MPLVHWRPPHTVRRHHDGVWPGTPPRLRADPLAEVFRCSPCPRTQTLVGFATFFPMYIQGMVRERALRCVAPLPA